MNGTILKGMKELKNL